MAHRSISAARHQRGRRLCLPSVEAPHTSRRIIERIVGAVFDVAETEFRAARRGTAEACFARQVAFYTAHVVFGLSFTEVGALFGRDRTTVAHACGVVEERRADPRLNHCLEHLERAVSETASALVDLKPEARRA